MPASMQQPQLKHSSQATACCQVHSRTQQQVAAPLPFARDLARPIGPAQGTNRHMSDQSFPECIKERHHWDDGLKEKRVAS